jgi:hypothetical protein
MLCRGKEIERAVQINIVSYGNGCSKCVVQIKLLNLEGRTHAGSTYTRTQARKRARTHARTHARAHATATRARNRARNRVRTQPRTRASTEDLECLKDLGLQFNFERRMSRLWVS